VVSDRTVIHRCGTGLPVQHHVGLAVNGAPRSADVASGAAQIKAVPAVDAAALVVAVVEMTAVRGVRLVAGAGGIRPARIARVSEACPGLPWLQSTSRTVGPYGATVLIATFDGVPMSTTGDHAVIYTCNGGANQQWKLP
jgi:hypothetical protein